MAKAMTSMLRRALWLLPVQYALSTSAQSLFWTVTSRYELSESVTSYDYDTSTDYYTYTTTRTIKSGVTPTASIVSTETWERSYADILEVSAFYPPDSVKETDLIPEDSFGNDITSTSSDYTATLFYMPVTYTAPARCTSSFTFSTDESVYIPTDVVDQIKPTSIASEPPSTYSTYVLSAYETWYLSAGAAPITTSEEYVYTEYIEQCTTPFESTFTGGGGGYNGGGDGSYSYTWCYGSLYDGDCTFKYWIIIVIVVSLVVGFLLIGFVESWFWYRRLMLGKSCLRLGTVSWICLSLWIACFTRKQSARSTEDQKLLREQWNAMKGSTKFKLWWKIGFRHRYPEEYLGRYDRNTIGIQKPGQPPVVNQYAAPGTFGGPPPPGAPMYVDQNGNPMMPQPYPVYFDPSKEGQTRVSEVPSMQTPAPGQPMYYPPSNMPPQNGMPQYLPPGAVPIPAPYAATRSPPPNGMEAPSPISSEVSASPFPQPAQPHQNGGLSPPQQMAGVQGQPGMAVSGSPSPVSTNANIAEAPTPQSIGSPVSQPAAVAPQHQPTGEAPQIPQSVLPGGVSSAHPPA